MQGRNLLSGNQIRQVFLDYFQNKGHSFIRASSVKPFGDPSLEFVNAGMNQFKNIFLGLEMSPFRRGTNSQKCIRVGGKHNDLNAVGHDSYHHTFFEMLGNWSFNDYFKEEACEMAWELVTRKPFAIDPRRLYVTYFGGDEKLNLKPDLETREIWLKLGIEKDRILPFGLKDNFWEMGPSGPCGPCTEIHYDHLGFERREKMVNQGHPDLTELWNVVFIQYNRLDENKLEKLPKHFVDTGMGLERLVALLQGKRSNYDTDIFTPYFSAISKLLKNLLSLCSPCVTDFYLNCLVHIDQKALTGAGEYRGEFGASEQAKLDTAFRIAADHSRMISIALGDEVLPDESYGLRRVIRRALSTCGELNKGDGLGLLTELCLVASDSFAHIFPEPLENLSQIKYILKDENEIWEETKAKVNADWEEARKRWPEIDELSDVRSVGLISSVKDLARLGLKRGDALPPQLCLVMYDRHGLSTQLIHSLANLLGYTIDMEHLEKDISDLKEKNKASLYSSKWQGAFKKSVSFIASNVDKTDDSAKMRYSKTGKDYEFEKVTCRVLGVMDGSDGRLLEEDETIESGAELMLVLDRTSLWASPLPSHTVEGDTATLHLSVRGKNIASASINRVLNINGYIYHFATISSESVLRVRDIKDCYGELLLDREKRLQLMQSASCAQLLALRSHPSRLRASSVSPHSIALTLSTFHQQFTDNDVQKLEEETEKLISEGINATMSRQVTSQLTALSGLRLPSTYNTSAMPYLDLVTFSFDPPIREIALGPNLLKSSDVGKVCIVGAQRRNRNREIILQAVAGASAEKALETGRQLLASLHSEDFYSEENVEKAKKCLKENAAPWSLRAKIENKLQLYKSSRKASQRLDKIELLKKTILEAEANCDKYIVLFCGDGVKLEKLSRVGENLPMFLFATNGNFLNARCYVPKGLEFSAEEWMERVAAEFGERGVPSKRHAPSVYYMTPHRLAGQPHQRSQALQKLRTAALDALSSLTNTGSSV